MGIKINYSKADRLFREGVKVAEIVRITGISRTCLYGRYKDRQKPKKKGSTDSPSLGNQQDLHKGIAKVLPNQKVFKNRLPHAERSVKVDHKTSLFVPVDDPRTDEEIRKSYLEREKQKLKNLK